MVLSTSPMRATRCTWLRWDRGRHRRDLRRLSAVRTPPRGVSGHRWPASFNAAGAHVAAHGPIIVGADESSELKPFRWVNTFISNLKTAITGTYREFDLSQAPPLLPGRGAVPL